MGLPSGFIEKAVYRGRSIYNEDTAKEAADEMKKKQYKYEFHVHTWFSKDSLLNKWFLLWACKLSGVNGVVITDHNSLRSVQYNAFFRNRGIDLINGEEIMTREGEIIGLFLEREIPPMMSAEMTVRLIKKQGGMVYIPHPYDVKRKKTVLSAAAIEKIIEDIDFVEFYNARTCGDCVVRKQKETAERILQRNPTIVKVAGSDSHTCWEIGKTCHIIDERISKETIKSCISKGKIQIGKGENDFSHRYTKLVKGIKLIRNLETMCYQSLSMQEVAVRCREFADSVAKQFRPDLIVFVAKGGFLIGKVFSDYFRVPLADISTERQGGKLKGYLAPVFKILPKRFRFWMIDLEMNLGIHKVSHERKICISKWLEDAAGNCERYKKILIVDDAVDTGNTAYSTKQAVQRLFPDAEVRMAAISVIRFSEEYFKTDYFLYKDTIIHTATSKDSREHNAFIEEFNRWEAGQI